MALLIRSALLPRADALQLLTQTITAAGGQVFVVGGAVRDALLGRPSPDIDLATSLAPERVLRLFSRCIPTGLQHGTVTVVLGPKDAPIHYEVTTFRSDGTYSDGRRPDGVRFDVSLEDDLARRDFTMNAMAWDLSRDVLVDPFGGQQDLAARTIRAVGDPMLRFAEDGLRAMRAVRFSSQLGFEVEAATRAAITARLDVLARVSPERWRDELHKLLNGAWVTSALTLARDSGVAGVVLPGLTLSDALIHGVARAPLPLRLPALLSNYAGDAAAEPPRAKDLDACLRRLRSSHAEIKWVQHLLGKLAMRVQGKKMIADVPAEQSLISDAVARAFMADAYLPASASAFGATAPAHECILLLRQAILPETSAAVPQLIEQCRRLLASGFPLTVADIALSGDDLVAMLPCRPGPRLGRLLRLLHERCLENPELNTKSRLLEVAREAWPQLA